MTYWNMKKLKHREKFMFPPASAGDKMKRYRDVLKKKEKNQKPQRRPHFKYLAKLKTFLKTAGRSTHHRIIIQLNTENFKNTES